MELFYKLRMGFAVGSAFASWSFMFNAGVGSLLGMAFFLIGLIFVYIAYWEVRFRGKKETKKKE